MEHKNCPEWGAEVLLARRGRTVVLAGVGRVVAAGFRAGALLAVGLLLAGEHALEEGALLRAGVLGGRVGRGAEGLV